MVVTSRHAGLETVTKPARHGFDEDLVRFRPDDDASTEAGLLKLGRLGCGQITGLVE